MTQNGTQYSRWNLVSSEWKWIPSSSYACPDAVQHAISLYQHKGTANLSSNHLHRFQQIWYIATQFIVSTDPFQMQDFAYVFGETHEAPFDSFLQLTKVPLSNSSAFQHNDCSCNLMSSAKLTSVFSVPSSGTLVKVLNSVVLNNDPWERPPVRSQTIDYQSLSPAVHLAFHTPCSPPVQFISPQFDYKDSVGYYAESLVSQSNWHPLLSKSLHRKKQLWSGTTTR